MTLRVSRLAAVAVGICLLAGCAGGSGVVRPPLNSVNAAKPDAPEAAAFRFEEVAAGVGLRFRWGHGGKSPLTALESFGCGCGFFDFDNDGWLDILLVGEPTCALYRNEPDGKAGRRFTDRTQSSRLVRIRGPWKGCAVGDFDNDGDLDLVLTGYHRIALLRNEDGKWFSDATAASRIRHRGWASSAGFADYDRDGDLDLFVGNYLQFGPHSVKYCTFPGGVRGGCPPQVYPAERGALYRNNGDGTFSTVTAASGMAESSGKTLAIGWCDFDDDGDADLYLANDGVPGDLYRNDGGRFTSIGILSGTAFGVNHLAQAGMGVDWADYNRDGRMDLVVTAFSDESYSLYRNAGAVFHNVSADVGIAEPTFKPLGFGCRFLDVDSDSWPDLVFANGHVYDQADRIDSASPYRQPLILMRNERGVRFTDVSRDAGGAFQRRIVGRGLAGGDFDNDGDQDLLVVDYDGSPLLLRNVTKAGNRVLRLRLRSDGRTGNRFAYGARVRVESSLGLQVGEVTPVSSYLSSSDLRLYFGLGRVASVDRVVIHWPSGKRESFMSPPLDGEVLIREGSGESVQDGASGG